MFINRQLKNQFILLAALCGAYIIGTQLTKGLSLFSLGKALFIISPLIFLFMIKSRPFWISIALGLIPLSVTIPVQILDRLQLTMIFCSLAIGVELLRIPVKKGIQRPVFDTFGTRCMLLTAAIVFLRILYDQPGSVRMGGTGGGREALYFVLATLVFIFFSRIASENWKIKSNLKLMVWIVLSIFGYNFIATSITRGVLPVFLHLFNPTLWFLSSFFLAWVYNKKHRMGSLSFDFKLICAICLVMLAGLSSPFRSRPVFALGIVTSISYLYGFLRRSSLTVIVIAFLGLGVILHYGPHILPASMLRSISTIVPVDSVYFRNYYSGVQSVQELGWKSNFRRQLLMLALNDIKEAPIVGRGFSFSRTEFFSSLMLHELSPSTGLESSGLALSGGYHNSLLELGAMCGLPAVIFFLIGFFAILLKFTRVAKSVQDPDLKLFSTGLFGFFVASSGQMLMNGGGTEFFYVCVILGVMNGIINRVKWMNNEKSINQT